MFCTNCGSELKVGQKFYTNCGAKTEETNVTKNFCQRLNGKTWA